MGVTSVMMRRWALRWSREQSDGSGEHGLMETEDHSQMGVASMVMRRWVLCWSTEQRVW